MKEKKTENKWINRKNISKNVLNEKDIKLSNMDNILRFTRGYDKMKAT